MKTKQLQKLSVQNAVPNENILQNQNLPLADYTSRMTRKLPRQKDE